MSTHDDARQRPPTGAADPQDQRTTTVQGRPPSAAGAGPARGQLDDAGRQEALQRSAQPPGGTQPGGQPTAPQAAAGAAEQATTVLPTAERRPSRGTRPDPRPAAPARGASRTGTRPASSTGRRRARLVLQRLDPWSVFVFSLVASICLGIVLIVAVAALYAVLSGLGVLSSLNDLLGEVLGSTGPDETVEPFFTAGRVLGATAVLAAVDVVLLTILATLGALLYNLCASLTGGVEVVLGERE